MNIKLYVTIWAYLWLAVVVVLLTLARRIGRARVATWLVVIGLLLVALEEPLFTFWLGISSPQSDRDGVATLVTAQAQAHLLDAAIFSTALFLLLGWVAIRFLSRGEQWARGLLFWGWVVVATTLIMSALFVHSRGLPLPTPGGVAGGEGFGWESLAVGLLAWALGLWLNHAEYSATRRALSAQT